jgi:hypothetical protein
MTYPECLRVYDDDPVDRSFQKDMNRFITLFNRREIYE